MSLYMWTPIVNVDSNTNALNTGTQHDKIGVVVVFMIGGGVTYAEARVVDTINRELNKHGDIRHVVLGGSNLLSSGDFIDLIRGSGHSNAWVA